VNPPEFLEPDAVHFLHDQSIREYGGYHGLRDEALLSSALNRPRNKFDYEDAADLFDLAAAYAFGIAKNHAFLDGNKRTAYACCVLFLKINDIELAVPATEAVEHTVALATSGLTEPQYAAWLRSRAKT
jgi:death-on-curing protein